MPDDPRIHTALVVYASDRSLVSTAVRPLDEPRDSFQMASLDHALWLHRPVRFDDWLLFASESPVAHSARGLILGSVFQRDGTRLGSVAQEGLVRLRRDAPSRRHSSPELAWAASAIPAQWVRGPGASRHFGTASLPLLWFGREGRVQGLESAVLESPTLD